MTLHRCLLLGSLALLALGITEFAYAVPAIPSVPTPSGVTLSSNPLDDGVTMFQWGIKVMCALIAVPTGVLMAILIAVKFGFMWGMLALLAVTGLLGLGTGWALSRWVQMTKADTPSGFLMQQLQVRFQRKKWIPPVGIYHYRRSGEQ